MSIGIRNFLKKQANQFITNSIALVSIGLSSPVAANEKQKIRYWIPIRVGATGGVRSDLIVPADNLSVTITNRLNNIVLDTVIMTSTFSFSNALANAGDHYLEIEVLVQNGPTAGTIDIQMAQNTADVLSLLVFGDATADIVKI